MRNAKTSFKAITSQLAAASLLLPLTSVHAQDLASTDQVASCLADFAEAEVSDVTTGTNDKGEKTWTLVASAENSEEFPGRIDGRMKVTKGANGTLTYAYTLAVNMFGSSSGASATLVGDTISMSLQNIEPGSDAAKDALKIAGASVLMMQEDMSQCYKPLTPL